MKRGFFRLIAALLVFCLLADPVTVSAFSGPVATTFQNNPIVTFQEQALISRLIGAFTSSENSHNAAWLRHSAAAAGIVTGTRLLFMTHAGSTIEDILTRTLSGILITAGMRLLLPGRAIAFAPGRTARELFLWARSKDDRKESPKLRRGSHLDSLAETNKQKTKDTHRENASLISFLSKETKAFNLLQADWQLGNLRSFVDQALKKFKLPKIAMTIIVRQIGSWFKTGQLKHLGQLNRIPVIKRIPGAAAALEQALYGRIPPEKIKHTKRKIYNLPPPRTQAETATSKVGSLEHEWSELRGIAKPDEAVLARVQTLRHAVENLPSETSDSPVRRAAIQLLNDIRSVTDRWAGKTQDIPIFTETDSTPLSTRIVGDRPRNFLERAKASLAEGNMTDALQYAATALALALEPGSENSASDVVQQARELIKKSSQVLGPDTPAMIPERTNAKALIRKLVELADAQRALNDKPEDEDRSEKVRILKDQVEHIMRFDVPKDQVEEFVRPVAVLAFLLFDRLSGYYLADELTNEVLFRLLKVPGSEWQGMRRRFIDAHRIGVLDTQKALGVYTGTPEALLDVINCTTLIADYSKDAEEHISEIYEELSQEVVSMLANLITSYGSHWRYYKAEIIKQILEDIVPVFGARDWNAFQNGSIPAMLPPDDVRAKYNVLIENAKVFVQEIPDHEKTPHLLLEQVPDRFKWAMEVIPEAFRPDKTPGVVLPPGYADLLGLAVVFVDDAVDMANLKDAELFVALKEIAEEMQELLNQIDPPSPTSMPAMIPGRPGAKAFVYKLIELADAHRKLAKNPDDEKLIKIVRGLRAQARLILRWNIPVDQVQEFIRPVAELALSLFDLLAAYPVQKSLANLILSRLIEAPDSEWHSKKENFLNAHEKAGVLKVSKVLGVYRGDESELKEDLTATSLVGELSQAAIDDISGIFKEISEQVVLIVERKIALYGKDWRVHRLDILQDVLVDIVPVFGAIDLNAFLNGVFPAMLPEAQRSRPAWNAEELDLARQEAQSRTADAVTYIRWHRRPITEQIMQWGEKILGGERIAQWIEQYPDASRGSPYFMTHPPFWRPLWWVFVAGSFMLAGRYIQPGSTRSPAAFQQIVHAVETAEKRGVHAVISLAGEQVNTEEEADQVLCDYIDFAQYAQTYWGDSQLSRHVAIKLSSLQPHFNGENPQHIRAVIQRMALIAESFRQAGLYLEIDGEFSENRTAQREITHAIQDAMAGWDGIGLAVHAYFDDVHDIIQAEIVRARLMGHRTGIRLVKGAYYDRERSENANVWRTHDEVDHAYRMATLQLLRATDAVYPIIASMNPREQSWAQVVAEREGLRPAQWAQHMLYGMQPDYLNYLIDQKANVWTYMVIGEKANAMKYFARRTTEITGENAISRRVYDHSVPIDKIAAFMLRLLPLAVLVMLWPAHLIHSPSRKAESFQTLRSA